MELRKQVLSESKSETKPVAEVQELEAVEEEPAEPAEPVIKKKRIVKKVTK